MLRKTLLLFSLILIAAGTLSTPLQTVHSQGNDDLPPPQIIDIWPAEGAELALSEPMTVTFDQPMDRASLESALQFDPKVQGKLSWVDTQTLEFAPDGGWSRAKIYTVTVSSAAKAVTGQAFEGPYRFKIQTLSGLHVSDVSPAADTKDIAPDAKIVVSFNHPVVALSSAEVPATGPDILSFDPPVRGEGQWINTSIYAFTPDSPLQLNTHYTVKIASGLSAVDQSVLDKDYTWEFQTVPPHVVRIEVMPDTDERYGYPVNVDLKQVPLDKPTVITFAQPMDLKSTQDAFALVSPKGKVNGTFSWNSDGTQLTFTPLVRLAADTDYVATLSASAQSADGGALPEVMTLKFRTVPYPRVEKSLPPDGQKITEHWQSVTIQFSAPVDADSFESHIQIVPKPEYVYSYLWNNGRRGQIYFDKDSNTTYTVTLKAGVQDRYGNKIADDYTFRVTTGDLGAKPVPLDGHPIINGDLQITDAARLDTSIKITTAPEQLVKFGVYRVSPESLSKIPLTNHQVAGVPNYFQGQSDYNGNRRCVPPGDVTPANLVRSWVYSASTDGGEAVVPLASAKGGKLPPGLYWITMGDRTGCQESRDAEPVSGYDAQFGLAVVTANMTIKRGTEDIFVWLTHLNDRTPLSGATVTIYGDGKVISKGTTGADGVVKLPTRMLEQRYIFITAEKPGEFAAWYNDYTPGWRAFETNNYWDADYISDPDSAVGYVYTDRPIYRPGDTVKFRGVMRFKRDMNFPLPTDKTVHIRIGKGWSYYGYTELYDNSDSPLLFNGQLPLSDYGTFDGEFKVPETGIPDTGQYVIQAALDSVSDNTPSYGYYYSPDNTAAVAITVASYRPAEFQVSAVAGQKTVFQGDPLQVNFQSSYYFGAPLSDAHISWTTYAVPTSFRYTGPGRYSFGYAGWYGDWYWESGADDDPYYYFSYYGASEVDGDSGVTGKDGSLRITTQTLPTDKDNNRYTGYPLRLTVEGTVTGDNGDDVSGRTSVIAYPSNLYIGLHAQLVKVKAPLAIDIIAVIPDSTPRPHQLLDISIEGYAWDAWGKYEPIRKASVITGADGKTTFSFTPNQPGVYRFTVSGADEKDRPNSSSLYLWVPDPKYAGQSWSDPTRGLTILTDKKSYEPGETAQLLIPVPFPGKSTVLLAVERAGVISYQILQAEGSTLSYQLPITDDFAPTAYVSAVFLADANPDNPYPHFATSLPARFSVKVVKPVLTVALTPSTKQARPGQTVKFDVQVTDSAGKPAQAEVGLALVDKAVLDLLKPTNGTLQSAFYGPQGRFIYTDVSLDGLLEAIADIKQAEIPGRGGGGGGGGGGDQLRDKFDTTPLWLPHVVTDKDGRASVEVALPDNLTTWQLDARAMTLDMKVGQANTEIVSSLPLLIRPVTPRFFVAGDFVQLAAIINNNTDVDQTVEAKLVASGLQLNADAAQTVRLGAGQRARVVWSALVQNAEGADLTFYATGQNGAKDATKPALRTGPNDTIPIYQYVAPSIGSTTGGMLRTAGSKTEVISLPQRLNTGQGELTVRLDPSLASALTGSFTYLRQFPHYCIEQTISTFLPNLTTFATLRQLGIQDVSLEANLRKNLDAALTKVAKVQNDDGGWGWFGDMDSNVLTTAYVILGLVEAQRAGYDIGPHLSQTNIDRALTFIREHAIVPSVGLQNWQLNRQAMVLYMLSRAGQVTQDDLDALFNVRGNLAYGSRALLLMAYHERFPDDPAVATLISDLVSGAKLGSTGAYWQESDLDWYNWNTDIRGTALALTALIRTDPENSLLPNVVRWLMMARSGDHWSTTQETVWSITGLAEWMVKTKELQANYTYTVNFNRSPLAKTAITAKNIDDVQVLHIAVKDLLTDNLNRLVVARGDGDGALYYTAQFKMSVPAADAKPISRGLSITRQYFLGDDHTSPITEARVGDTITVRVVLDVQEDLRYFVLEDMFPSGTEPVNPDLLTSKHNAEGPRLGTIWYGDTYWYWGWWRFRHTELTDSEAKLYADYLPRGTYIYTYQLKATLPGNFQVIPSYGYTFYFSEIFGRSAGSMFHILPPVNTPK